MTRETGLTRELEERLHARRAEWADRLDRIQADRRHERGPLAADSQEQAIERENDETLDALDVRGRQELEAIDAALARISNGEYGECVRCGEEIPTARLRAQPEAIDCVDCAR
jgi:RNA polymerase-binding transcription factor DksA